MTVEPQKSKNEKDHTMLLALMLFIGAAGLILAYLGTSESNSKSGKSSAVRSEKFEGAVNKHLKFTNDKVEFEQRRMQIENSQLLGTRTRSGQSPQAYANENKLDLSSEDHASEIAKELGRGPRGEDYATPDEVVQKELYNSQMMAEYSQAYREEYARQFVENARRGGYKVILSEDLSRVISVTPLKKAPPNSFEVFGSGAQPVQ